MTEANQAISIKKYTYYFGLTYFGLAFCVGFISDFLSLKVDYLVAPTLIAAAMVPIDRFIKDFQRLPTKAESRSLIWGCIGMSCLVSLVQIAMLLLIIFFEGSFQETWYAIQDFFQKITAETFPIVALILFSAIVIMIGVSYGVFSFVFKVMGKTMLKQVEKKRALQKI